MSAGWEKDQDTNYTENKQNYVKTSQQSGKKYAKLLKCSFPPG